MKADLPSSRQPRWSPTWLKIAAGIGFGLILVGVYLLAPWIRTRLVRSVRLGEWFLNGDEHPDWTIRAGERCGEAPLVMPTDGYIGFIWGDSFRPGHRHQGLDIFGGQEAGKTPVVAAATGYLTRLPEWRSAVILRLPQDPLQPDRKIEPDRKTGPDLQIWLYYTHMADRGGNSFISELYPPGTEEAYVEAGTLLGYQGNYSGDPFNPTGVHLHFSIVLDDGQGRFRNELEIANTLDPSPYLGLPLNASANTSTIPICSQHVQPSGN